MASLSKSKVRFFRCPDLITHESRNKEMVGRPGSGCWTSLALSDITFYKRGIVHCPHCNGHMGEVRGLDVGKPPEDDIVPFKFRIVRIPASSLETVFRGLDVACCYNKECSTNYLHDTAKLSDADISGKPQHSGTQFLFNRNSTDTWQFNDDKAENDTPLEPYNDITGKSWRACIFCGSLLRIQRQLASARKIYRNSSDNDQGWFFPGPAATFRIYREQEWQELHVEKSPSIAANA